MDTSRIIINTYDNSSTLVEATTPITGFTVVCSEKGPRTPIKIASGGAAKMKDIFGVSSSKYPELFEAETFNKEYDLYISAPYETAKVPTALITKDGVFPSVDLLDYDDKVENLVLNPEAFDEELPIKGISDFTGQVAVLKDTRYPKTNNISETAKDLDLTLYAYPAYIQYRQNADTKYALAINTGLVKADVKDKLNYFLIRGLLGLSSNEVLLTLEDNDFKDKDRKVIARIGKLDTNKEIVGMSTCASEDILSIFLIGADNAEITPKYIEDYLNQEAERAALSTFWKVNINKEDIYGVMFPKYPSERKLNISFAAFNPLVGYYKDSISSRNIYKITVYEDGAFHDNTHKISFTGSLDRNDTDNSGNSISFDTMNASQELLFVYINEKFKTKDFNQNIEQYPAITLEGGERTFPAEEFVNTEDVIPNPVKIYYVKNIATSKFEICNPQPKIFEEDIVYYEKESNEIKLHDLGWKLAENEEYSDVDLFFDSAYHGKESLAKLRTSYFFELAGSKNSTRNLAGYWFGYSLAPSVMTDDYVPSESDKLSFGRNYWNTCNEGIVLDEINSSRFISPLTGAKSVMEARILENRLGGVAPMWKNSGTPSMGGQLNNIVSVYKMRYKYNKKQLDILDSLNYNPIVNDRQYGLMSVGQKTCKPGEITDWSYIGHAAAFFNFLKVIKENVLIPQIGKPNNPYYRTLRKEQVEEYLVKRLTGNNRIWAEASVDTSTADGVNDLMAQKQRKFVINVRVKVDVFSETVELNFTNEDQATMISAE